METVQTKTFENLDSSKYIFIKPNSMFKDSDIFIQQPISSDQVSNNLDSFADYLDVYQGTLYNKEHNCFAIPIESLQKNPQWKLNEFEFLRKNPFNEYARYSSFQYHASFDYFKDITDLKANVKIPRDEVNKFNYYSDIRYLKDSDITSKLFDFLENIRNSCTKYDEIGREITYQKQEEFSEETISKLPHNFLYLRLDDNTVSPKEFEKFLKPFNAQYNEETQSFILPESALKDPKLENNWKDLLFLQEHHTLSIGNWAGINQTKWFCPYKIDELIDFIHFKEKTIGAHKTDEFKKNLLEKLDKDYDEKIKNVQDKELVKSIVADNVKVSVNVQAQNAPAKELTLDKCPEHLVNLQKDNKNEVTFSYKLQTSTGKEVTLPATTTNIENKKPISIIKETLSKSVNKFLAKIFKTTQDLSSSLAMSLKSVMIHKATAQVEFKLLTYDQKNNQNQNLVSENKNKNTITPEINSKSPNIVKDAVFHVATAKPAAPKIYINLPFKKEITDLAKTVIGHKFLSPIKVWSFPKENIKPQHAELLNYDCFKNVESCLKKLKINDAEKKELFAEIMKSVSKAQTQEHKEVKSRGR